MSKKLGFVFLKPYETTEDIGIVLDLNQEESRVKVATLDMGANFSIKEVSLNEVMTLPKIVIKSILGDISRNQKRYAYFIIMLNSLDDLREYHIKENQDLKEIRASLRGNNSYIPSSTSVDVQYLLMKLEGYMKDHGLDPWQDDKFTSIAKKYFITKDNI